MKTDWDHFQGARDCAKYWRERAEQAEALLRGTEKDCEDKQTLIDKHRARADKAEAELAKWEDGENCSCLRSDDLRRRAERAEFRAERRVIEAWNTKNEVAAWEDYAGRLEDRVARANEIGDIAYEDYLSMQERAQLAESQLWATEKVASALEYQLARFRAAAAEDGDE